MRSQFATHMRILSAGDASIMYTKSAAADSLHAKRMVTGLQCCMGTIQGCLLWDQSAGAVTAGLTGCTAYCLCNSVQQLDTSRQDTDAQACHGSTFCDAVGRLHGHRTHSFRLYRLSAGLTSGCSCHQLNTGLLKSRVHLINRSRSWKTCSPATNSLS